MIKESLQEEHITLINIYAPNIEAPQYIRQLLRTIKEKIDSNTIIVEAFNTSLTPMDKSSRQKINTETQALNDTRDQIDLIDIYRTFHPKESRYSHIHIKENTLQAKTGNKRQRWTVYNNKRDNSSRRHNSD